MTSGIYKITNTVDGMMYIGQSKNIETRWKQHLYGLIKGRHHCPSLQVAWLKFGKDVFDFSILEIIDTDLDGREYQYLIDNREKTYNSYQQSYSIKAKGTLSQTESKSVVEKARAIGAYLPDKCMFARLTPSNVAERLSKAGVAVDENWINSAARRG